jgi:TolA protein
MVEILFSLGILGTLVSAIVILICYVKKRPMKIPIIFLFCSILYFTLAVSLSSSEPLKTFPLVIGFLGYISSLVLLLIFNHQKKSEKFPTFLLTCFAVLYFVAANFIFDSSTRTLPLQISLIGTIVSLTQLIVYAIKKKPLKIPTITLASLYFLFIGSTGDLSSALFVTCLLGIPIAIIFLIVFALQKKALKMPAISLATLCILFIFTFFITPEVANNTTSITDVNETVVAETNSTEETTANNQNANTETITETDNANGNTSVEQSAVNSGISEETATEQAINKQISSKQTPLEQAAAEQAAIEKAAVDQAAAEKAAAEKAAAEQAAAEKAAAEQLQLTATYDALDQSRLEAALSLEQAAKDEAAAEQAAAEKAAAEQAAAEQAAAEQAAAEQAAAEQAAAEKAAAEAAKPNQVLGSNKDQVKDFYKNMKINTKYTANVDPNAIKFEDYNGIYMVVVEFDSNGLAEGVTYISSDGTFSGAGSYVDRNYDQIINFVTGGGAYPIDDNVNPDVGFDYPTEIYIGTMHR